MSEAAENPRAVIGGNSPPEPSPFEIASNTADALFEEAKHWVDAGAVITSQEEADAVGLLLDQARKALKFVDERRAAEKKPHDDAGKAVQAKYKPPLWRVEQVMLACKEKLTPWLAAKDAEARRIAEEARLKAEAAAEEARQSVRRAEGFDDKEAAEAQLREARRLEDAAARAERAGAQAMGGDRAIGLRTSYHAEIVDLTAFARFVWTNHLDELRALLTPIAQRLVRNGQRSIPGVNITETKRAA